MSIKYFQSRLRRYLLVTFWEMLMILIKIVRLIADEMTTRKPIIKHQILMLLLNSLGSFLFWKGYLTFFICLINCYLWKLPTPIKMSVNKIIYTILLITSIMQQKWQNKIVIIMLAYSHQINPWKVKIILLWSRNTNTFNYHVN